MLSPGEGQNRQGQTGNIVGIISPGSVVFVCEIVESPSIETVLLVN